MSSIDDADFTLQFQFAPETIVQEPIDPYELELRKIRMEDLVSAFDFPSDDSGRNWLMQGQDNLTQGVLFPNYLPPFEHSPFLDGSETQLSSISPQYPAEQQSTTGSEI